MKKILLIFCLIVILGVVLLILKRGYERYNQIISRRDVQFLSSQDLIKVMTFNVRVDFIFDIWNRWDNRKDIVFDILADNAADVMGLQEITDFQIQQVHQALPQYDYYAVGRNDGNQKGECCAIFYRKNRFKLVDSGTFWFSDTPLKPGTKYFRTIFPRICSWVYLVEKDENIGFYVYNIHLSKISQSSREKSVELLLKQIASRSKMQEPFIVMGDFNMELDNFAMKYLQGINCQNPYLKMKEAWQFLHPDKSFDIGTFHDFTGCLSGPKIDHIFIGNACAFEVNIDRRNVDGQYPSDHFPVIANISLRK